MKEYRAGILSSLTLAFALLGDSFLYAALPTNAEALYVPTIWIGFLLSINRILRIFLNHFFVFVFEKYGFRKITILASVLSVISTLMYSFSTSILLWILARVLWALCFCVLRFSSIQYSITRNRNGFSLGLSKSIQEIGPFISLLLGPIIANYTSLQNTFFVLGIISLFSIVFSFFLPEIFIQKNTSRNIKLYPSSFNNIVFFSSLIVEGILVVLLSTLLINNQTYSSNVLSIVSILLLFKRLSNVIMSPLAGYLCDYFSLEKIFMYAISITIIALILIGTNYIIIGIIIAFIASSMSSALSPVLNHKNPTNKLHTIAANVSWRDIGTAMGAFIGGFFIHSTSTKYIFFIATFALAVALFIHVYNLKLISIKNGN